MQLNNIFVPFELARELKKLNFDEPCLALFELTANPLLDRVEGNLRLGKNPAYITCEKQMVYVFGQMTMLAPTWEQAFKFFRDKYKYNCEIGHRISFHDYLAHLYPIFPNTEVFNCGKYNTYEEAREESLKKLIQIAKDEKEGYD